MSLDPYYVITHRETRQQLFDIYGLRKGEYRCVRGPWPYHPDGSWWRFQEFACTLIDGYWPPGSVWEFEDGTHWVVRGNEDLQADPPPEGHESWRAQTLVEV